MSIIKLYKGGHYFAE